MNTMHYQIKQKLIKLDVKVSLHSNAYVKNVITSTNVAVISSIFMWNYWINHTCLAMPNQYTVIK